MDTAQQEQQSGPDKYTEIARILGEMDMQFVDWESIMGQGIIGILHVSRFRFRQRARFSDFGLHFSDKDTQKAMEDIFRLGMKNMLPTKMMQKMDNAEARARRILSKNSIHTVWGFFVPWSSYEKLKEELDEVEKEYFEIMQEILKNYKRLRHNMVQQYTVAAKNSYRILRAVSLEGLSEAEQESQRIYLLEKRKKFYDAFPSREKIEASFSFRLEKTYIDLPRLVGGEIADAPAAPGSLVSGAISGLTEDQTEQLRLTQASMDQRREMMRKMNADVVRDAEKTKREKIDAFFTDIIGQIRWLTYSTASNVLDSIQKKGKLDPANSKSLFSLISAIRQLNFYGDKELDIVMEQIRDLLAGQMEGSRKKINASEIARKLANISVVMRTSLIALDYEPRGERESDTRLANFTAPTLEEEREARESLGFAIPQWLQSSRSEREEDNRERQMIVVGTGRQERKW